MNTWWWPQMTRTRSKNNILTKPNDRIDNLESITCLLKVGNCCDQRTCLHWVVRREGTYFWNRLYTRVAFSKVCFHRIKYESKYWEGSWSPKGWLALRGATSQSPAKLYLEPYLCITCIQILGVRTVLQPRCHRACRHINIALLFTMLNKRSPSGWTVSGFVRLPYSLTGFYRRYAASQKVAGLLNL
jgi:hypothetical protein